MEVNSKMGKKIAIGLFAVFILLQFLQPALPEVTLDNPKDLLVNNPEIPADVAALLKNSCYDCHSNTTSYPWYSHLSPVSILVVRDINVGRDELNFSNWENLKKIEKASALDDIYGIVEADEMPMPIYTLIHQDAKLSEEEKQLLLTWTEDFGESLFE